MFMTEAVKHSNNGLTLWFLIEYQTPVFLCSVEFTIPENIFLSNLNGSVTKTKNSKYFIVIKEFYQVNTCIYF